MREIRFRAWDRKRKKFCEMLIAQGSIATKREYLSHDLEPWQQFTGLRDRNGTKIYEGDIVQQVDSFGSRIFFPVKWIDEAARFSWKPSSSSYPVEVIGNIHEQPEILNEKN